MTKIKVVESDVFNNFYIHHLCRVRGEVPEEDALVERPPQAPVEATVAPFPLESPLAPVVVEGPVGGHVLYVMLRPRLGDVAVDKLGDLAGRLGRLHTPQLVDVVLAN